MNLSKLRPSQKNKKSRRIGRGESSGAGKTSGKGHKGQKARSGGKVGRGFEGGQMPLQRRLPKRGFTNPFKVEYNIINLRDIARFDAGTAITGELLREQGLVKRQGPIKLLAVGEVAGPYTVKVDRISVAAKMKIEAAGGNVEVL